MRHETDLVTATARSMGRAMVAWMDADMMLLGVTDGQCPCCGHAPYRHLGWLRRHVRKHTMEAMKSQVMSAPQAEYVTKSLIEQARLTEEEITSAERDAWHGGTWSDNGIADAAMAKALWVVVEWLEQAKGYRTPYAKELDCKWLTVDLTETLVQAGIERPKGAHSDQA